MQHHQSSTDFQHAVSARKQSFHDKKHLLKKLRRHPLPIMADEPSVFTSDKAGA